MEEQNIILKLIRIKRNILELNKIIGFTFINHYVEPEMSYIYKLIIDNQNHLAKLNHQFLIHSVFISDHKNQKSLTSINSRLNYLKRRFNIKESNFSKLKYEYLTSPINRKLIEDSYREFISDCRSRKIKSTEFKDTFFLQQIQKELIKKHLETINEKELQKLPIII